MEVKALFAPTNTITLRQVDGYRDMICAQFVSLSSVAVRLSFVMSPLLSTL